MPFAKINYFLLKERGATFNYLLAIILSLLLSAYLFPWSFLQGHGAFFEKGDAMQHVAGWLFYVNDQWRFPLAYTQPLNYPEGANIALTDSIPLAAVVMKLFRAWLPEGFHYFGWWHLFAYLLQAIAATLLIRALGYRSLIATITAVSFSLLMPALTNRFGHTSLTTQGLILFALAAYVLGIKKEWSLLPTSCFFIVISIAALLIHPYLFGMTYPIYLAFLIDFSVKNRVVKPCLTYFALSVVAILLIFFLFGYFGMGGDWGFGVYSMNLLAPFCGGKYFFHCQFDPSQYLEGFNYFGLGLMLLLAAAIIVNWRWLLQLPGRFPAVMVMMILFWLFALSNNIHFGRHTWIHIHLSDSVIKFADIYRASGRLFWPVGYALLFMSILGVLHCKKKWLVTPILLIGIVLQWLDTQPLMDSQRIALRKPADTFIDPSLDLMARGVSAIDIFPIVINYHGDYGVYMFFQMFAAKKHLAINTATFAHYVKDPDEKLHFFDQDLASNHLFIIIPANPAPPIPKNIQYLLQGHQCRELTIEGTKVSACL